MRILVNYLQKRGNRYFFRMAIPKDVRQYYGKREINKALGTDDEFVAAPKAQELGEAYLAEFARYRGMEPMPEAFEEAPKPRLPESKLIELAEAYAVEMVERAKREGVDWSEHELTFPGREGETSRAERLAEWFDMEIDKLQDGLNRAPLVWLESKETGRECREKWSQWLGERGFAEPTAQEWERLLPHFVNAECSGLALIRDMGVSQLSGNLYTKLREQGDLGTQRAALVASQTETAPEEKDSSPLFSECAALRLEAAESERVSEDRRKHIANTVEMFTAWLGDRPIGSYSRQEVRDFRDKLLRRLPPRFADRFAEPRPKGEQLRKAMTGILQESKQRGQRGQTTYQTLNVRTVNMYTGNVAGVFKHAMAEGLFLGSHNPAAGLELKQAKAEKRPYRPYNPDQLERMVRALAKGAQEGGRHWQEWKLWIPLIGLYQGARVNEIAQMHVGDFRKTEGFWCFHFEEDPEGGQGDRRLKNDSSWRVVPLHPKLEQLGFPAFHGTLSASVANPESENLWHQVGLNPKGGDWGKAASQWFGIFRKHFLTEDELARAKDKSWWLNFHSFRHTFIGYAQNQAHMRQGVAEQLTGHARTDTSEVHLGYAGEFTLAILHEELSKLDYGLDLSPLQGLF